MLRSVFLPLATWTSLPRKTWVKLMSSTLHPPPSTLHPPPSTLNLPLPTNLLPSTLHPPPAHRTPCTFHPLSLSSLLLPTFHYVARSYCCFIVTHLLHNCSIYMYIYTSICRRVQKLLTTNLLPRYREEFQMYAVWPKIAGPFTVREGGFERVNASVTSIFSTWHSWGLAMCSCKL